jgi:hypothetical protein
VLSFANFLKFVGVYVQVGEVVAGLASRGSGWSTVSLAVCGIFVLALAEAVVHPELLPSTRSHNSDLLLLLSASTPEASARLERGAPALEPGRGKVCTDQHNVLVRHTHAHD